MILEEDGKEVIEITQYEENGEKPKFRIVDFSGNNNVFIYKRSNIDIEGVEEEKVINDKEKFIQILKNNLD